MAKLLFDAGARIIHYDDCGYDTLQDWFSKESSLKPRRLGENTKVSIGMENPLNSIYAKYMWKTLFFIILSAIFTMIRRKTVFSFQTQFI